MFRTSLIFQTGNRWWWNRLMFPKHKARDVGDGSWWQISQVCQIICIPLTMPWCQYNQVWEAKSRIFAIVRIKLRGTYCWGSAAVFGDLIRSALVTSTRQSALVCFVLWSPASETSNKVPLIFILTKANVRDFASHNQPSCKAFEETITKEGITNRSNIGF